jgi:hypothetical protein
MWPGYETKFETKISRRTVSVQNNIHVWNRQSELFIQQSSPVLRSSAVCLGVGRLRYSGAYVRSWPRSYRCFSGLKSAHLKIFSLSQAPKIFRHIIVCTTATHLFKQFNL